VITFSDGDNIRLSPDTWTKGAWTRVDGGGDNWSDAGLSGCAALQDASYQQALSCQQRKGAHVTGAFVVTDGLSSVSNVIVFVDSVTYGGSNITSGIAQNGPAKLSSTRLTVSSRTGRGSLNTGCNVLSGDSCHYSLILRAGGHTIGRLTGTIDGGLTGNLSIRLNSRGIALLRRNRVVHAVARGTQINDVGFGFQVNKRVTITR
jgi:hypothetical protein